jgi:predicted ATPase
MLTNFQLVNFKSWKDTDPIRLAPLTVFFGRNSSGKSSLLQANLLMKQTAESLDPKQVLDLGSSDSYTDLGTYRDLILNHNTQYHLRLYFSWTLPDIVTLRHVGSRPLSAGSFGFMVEIGQERGKTLELGELVVHEMKYDIGSQGTRSVGLKRNDFGEFELETRGITITRRRGRPSSLPGPVKCYGFPDAVYNAYQNADFLAELSLRFDDLMSGISYVGPLRERPQRSYQWRGSSPASVGPRGENTVAAILAARRQNRKMGRDSSKGRPYRSFEGNLGYWLNRLGVIDDFAVEEIASGTDLYELRVTVSGGTTRVSVTDVGFGVSQVLPVLVQVFYAPRQSTVILEQPEIHLHPAAQSELGDVLLAANRDNEVQLLVETHSEHLLRRLQRRIAEGEVSDEDVALYFVETHRGESQIYELIIDQYGNITNWPADFFGDEIGDLSAMTEAAVRRGVHLA